MVDVDINGNCAAGYSFFYLMSCAPSGAGAAADPSSAKTYCSCPSGQTYQTIKKCSLMPLTCPAGQGNVIVYTVTSPLTATMGQKCVPVTNSDANGKCPEGKVLATATLTLSEANSLTATLVSKKMCVAGSLPNGDGNCPASTQPGDGYCVATLNSGLPATSPDNTGTPKDASPPAPQSAYSGGGSCSLIR